MANQFDRGSRIVLLLLVVFGMFFAFQTSRQIQADEEIIAETDARTEHLLDRVDALEARVQTLEGR